MVATAEEFQFHLSVVLNQDKVLYAKVSGDFVDVLLSFLTLPLGTIVRLLVRKYGHETPILGSLSSLYKGLRELAIENFYWEAGKRLLLEPRNSFEARCRKLKVKIDDTAPIRYFICRNRRCTKYPKCVSMYYDSVACCYCERPIDSEVIVEDSNVETPSGGGVFVTSRAQSFIVADDLRILPDLPEFALQILQDYGVEDTVGLQERPMIFGYLEMMELLKFSLVSKNPLTDTILNGRNMTSAKVNQEPVSFVPQIVRSNLKSRRSEKMNVTAFVQKSTNRILSVQAGKDFVEFLFTLLTIPLGKAEFLLKGNTCLGRVDNLYRSVRNLIRGKHIFTPHHSTNSLLDPQLPPNYVSVDHILPLTQQSSLPLLRDYNRSAFKCKMFNSCNIKDRECPICTIDPKGLKPRAFMVTDDLVVTSACDFSISMLQQTGIPLNDIETHVFDVGMKEALNILKASLTSSLALTNGLKQCLNRENKRESADLDILKTSLTSSFALTNGLEQCLNIEDKGESEALVVARSVSNRQISSRDIILALCVVAFSAFIFYAILPTKKSPSEKD